MLASQKMNTIGSELLIKSLCRTDSHCHHSITGHHLVLSFIVFFYPGDFANRFTRSYIASPEYKYPVIMWDLLPHGGASQVHPHLQLVLKSNRYPGQFNSILLLGMLK